MPKLNAARSRSICNADIAGFACSSVNPRGPIPADCRKIQAGTIFRIEMRGTGWIKQGIVYDNPFPNEAGDSYHYTGGAGGHCLVTVTMQ
ncbi:MAG: hypothetical protein OXD44_00280 [Gammaproteobacteria bacterium]|nr:hypothetical protein [Gammaproteobacteria bacterium]